MKILAFSDLHRDQRATRTIVEASDSADILVGAGDFATCGLGLTETLSILKSCDKPMILVCGNHDYLSEFQGFCSDWPKAHLLHGDQVIIDDVTFFGLGYEIPQRNFEDWNQTLSDAEATAILSKCPRDAVLVTHTPPFGHADMQKDGTHEGSEALLEFVTEKSPPLHLCGHIHNSWGVKSKIGETSIHNLGPTVNWFDI